MTRLCSRPIERGPTRTTAATDMSLADMSLGGGHHQRFPSVTGQMDQMQSHSVIGILSVRMISTALACLEIRHEIRRA